MLEPYPKGQEGVTCLMEKRRKHLRQSTAGTETWESRLAPPQGWRGPGGVG